MQFTTTYALSHAIVHFLLGSGLQNKLLGALAYLEVGILGHERLIMVEHGRKLLQFDLLLPASAASAIPTQRYKFVVCLPAVDGRGVATKFCLGDGFMGTQTHLPPKFSFSSDFGHFISKMLENAKFAHVSIKMILKYYNFWGGDVPR